MKKIFSIIAIFITLTVTTVYAASCSKEIEFKSEKWSIPDDYKSGTVQENMSAFDLFMEVVERKENSDSHYIYSVRDFRCDTAPISNNQVEIWTGIVDGDKWLKKSVEKGEGIVAAKKTGYKTFYFDGQDYYYNENSGSKVVVDLNNPDFDTLCLKAYNAEEGKAKLDSDLEFTSYVLGDEYLSSNHDDKVYLLDDTYYFTITIATFGKEGVQSRVEKVIADNIGMGGESFEWLEDTVIYCCVNRIDNKYYLTAREMIEQYKGKASGLSGTVYQSTSAVYDYNSDRCKIADDMVQFE